MPLFTCGEWNLYWNIVKFQNITTKISKKFSKKNLKFPTILNLRLVSQKFIISGANFCVTCDESNLY